MLLELRIKDFAIIEGITIAFGPGLNIFTGQTGAGKSIIIDAIELVLGDRARGDLIRGEREEAVVEAMFSVDGVEGIEGILKDAGIPHGDDLVIKRVVQRAGRNRVYVNGSLATLVTLSELARHLIDIYGQSEHTSLTRPDEHVELLDSFGGFGGLRAEMAEAYGGYVSISRELERLKSSAFDSAQRKDFLEFQLEELGEADLQPGEEEGLRRAEERLRNSDLLKEAAWSAEKEIYSREGSMTERLGALLAPLREAASIDPRLAETVNALESSMYQLEDAAAFLRDYGGRVDSDPGALEAAGARLDLIGKLKKKYGGAIDEILERKRTMEEELAGITVSEERTSELDTRLFAAGEKASFVAKRLGSERIRAARELKGDIEAELADLGMPGAIFEVVIEQDVNPDGTLRFGEKGSDRITFFISPNPGEEVKPLANIASGGELSRIMLAVKRVSAAGRVPTLVFDEIDTGVGGAMAQAVGLKLNEVSSSHQVICITHMPQIAAFADSHYSVAKGQTGEGRTVTTIRALEDEERITEMSVMLGGREVTDTTKSHARELCDDARRLVAERASPNRGKRGKRGKGGGGGGG